MPVRKPHAAHLDVPLVRRLLAEQFPEWVDLPIRPVPVDGWDNTTFRLGDVMSVRLPSGPAYAAQVDKEHEWLPYLAPRLPLPIPSPLAKGAPTDDFPLPWSVYGWIEGEVAAGPAEPLDARSPVEDLERFAADLAAFLVALQGVDASGGPAPGPHNFFRGGSLTVYDGETREALGKLGGRADVDACAAVWEEALDATWDGPPVWVHGDVATTNLLVRDGRLAAMIDFGCSAVGDPACDLVIAWTALSGDARDVFVAGMPADEAMWARAKGWSIWAALKGVDHPDASVGAWCEYVIGEVLGGR